MNEFKEARLQTNYRIGSIDILRGIVMVIMALDHVRDFFHHDALVGHDPLDLNTTWPVLFATRWITHFCAPVFVFLSGTSVFLYSQKGRTRKQVAFFLFTRGIWLMLAEIFVVNVLWEFSFGYFLMLQV
ncbi:MAG: heparan-alpha-glucosaminide N-acetyltransferase domain-containing protein, partial [Ginsengibacter sp.]